MRRRFEANIRSMSYLPLLTVSVKDMYTYDRKYVGKGWASWPELRKENNKLRKIYATFRLLSESELIGMIE